MRKPIIAKSLSTAPAQPKGKVDKERKKRNDRPTPKKAGRRS